LPLAPHVSNARLILVFLICASPAALLLDGALFQGILAGVLAVGVATVALTLRPGEATFLALVFRPIAVITALAAIWMLIQALPLRPLAHPIWSSAEAALGHPIAGSISIDTGASVMALGQWLTTGALVFLSAAVSVDRQRADWTLFALISGAALIALVLTIGDFFGFSWVNAVAVPQLRAQAVDCSALGVILCAAAAVRTIERLETRNPEVAVAVSPTRWFVAAGAAFALCLLALASAASTGVMIATGYGAAAFLAAMAIRRLGLGAWGVAAVAVFALSTLAMLVANVPGLRSSRLPLALATDSPASLTEMTNRMLDDSPWIGTGAGTFDALASVYREADDPFTAVGAPPPTTASVVAIELGKPVLWSIVSVVLVLFAVLFRASLQRGRDAFYPAAGAGCLITLLLLSFMNAGLSGTAAIMYAATALGLAFAQSKSRTAQLQAG
jgi:hypothetical protein